MKPVFLTVLSLALAFFGAINLANAARYDDGEGGAKAHLSRVVIRLNEGEQWGTVGVGGFCKLTLEKLRWTTGDIEANTPRLAAIFETEAKSSGNLSPQEESLFDDGPSDALQIGAVVTHIDGKLCGFNSNVVIDHPEAPVKPVYSGSMTLAIEWQIYSPTLRKLVGRVNTNETGNIKGYYPDGISQVFISAMRANMRALVNSPDYRSTVSSPSQEPAPQISDPLILATGRRDRIGMDDAARSVVSIFAGDAMGSGVLVSSDGYVLTNRHVIGDLNEVRVQWSDGTSSMGSVVRTDATRDVALIKTTTRVEPLTVRATPLKLGDTVYALGTPLDRTLAGTLTRGVVSGFRTQNGLPIIQSDVAVTHGNSGGPLLDENGKVVALTVSGREENGASVSINFFIPIDDALKALSLQPAPVQ